MAKIADITPPNCSVCWQTRDDIRHVDFEVAHEGPVLFEGTTPVQIDQLVICESCLKAGGELVGLVDWAERADLLADLQAQLQTAEAELVKARRYATDLERAVQSKPGRRTSPTRPASTPEPVAA